MSKTVRALHVAWALLCAGVSVFLALVDGGHPPPLVLVPFVGVAWVLGHAGLWSVVRLTRRGRRARPRGGGWPPGLVVVTLGLAGVTAVTAFAVAASALMGKPYPYRGALWFLMAGVGAVHAAGLVGVLLRRGWGRAVAALVCFGWGAVMVQQVVDHLAYGRSMSVAQGALALALFALPVGLGVYLITAVRVRAYFAPGT